MTGPTLLDQLRGLTLLDAAVLDELAGLPQAADPDPRALGKVIHRRKLLTKWQLSLIAAGRGKELFVGPFVLEDKLGEGGMGQVFRAHHRHMGRQVALKVIKKERLAKPGAVQRFFQEVQAASRLNHPNIVTAYDADLADGVHYFAMEMVDGIDLARTVREGTGPLPPAAACEYVRQAALGTQHAHDKGLVHRDIKPHNLLLTTSGGKPVVKLLDLGLARLGQPGDSGLTQSGQVLGTPDYLAPEQAYDSRQADARSDVYSLGCTLYFLLTGAAPFTGESLMQVLLHHKFEPHVPPSRVRPDVPPELDAVLARMIAKQPDDRYQTAADVAVALEPFSKGELPLPVRRPPREESEAWTSLTAADEVVRPPAAPKRRWPLGLILGAWSLVIAGVLAFALWPPPAPKDNGPVEPPDKDKDKEPPPVVVVKDVEPPPKVKPATEPFAVYEGFGKGGPLTVSPGGRLVVAPGPGPGIRVLDTAHAAAQVRRVSPAPRLQLPSHLRVLPDARFVVFVYMANEAARTYRTAAVDLIASRVEWETEVHSPPTALDVSPDGTLVVLASSAEPARLIDVATGKPVRPLADGAGVSGLRFLPDGKRILGRGRPGQMRLWRVADGAEAGDRKLTTAADPVFSGDGRFAAFAAGGAVQVLDVEAGTVRRIELERGSTTRTAAAWGDGRHAVLVQVPATGCKVVLIDVPEARVAAEAVFADAGPFAAGAVAAGDARRLFALDVDGTLRGFAFAAPKR